MSESIVFLTYLARSGSTYLASKLDGCSGVRVGIEARFVDGWTTPGFLVENEAQLQQYISSLYVDEKFRKWNIPEDVLQAQCTNLSFPVQFSDILSVCLAEYFKDDVSSVQIHKRGDYYQCVGRILKELPNAKFIFIDRDPRAIYNSQSKSLDSKTNLPMMSDIVHFVLEYNKEQQMLLEASKFGCFYICSYEQLLRNENQEIKKILNFLDVQIQDNVQGKSSYFDTIPDAQKHLHEHVKSGTPVLKRINGWQEELCPGDRIFLDIVLSATIKEKGYLSGKKICFKPAELKKLSISLARYYYERIKRAALSNKD